MTWPSRSLVASVGTVSFTGIGVFTPDLATSCLAAATSRPEHVTPAGRYGLFSGSGLQSGWFSPL